MIEQEADVIQRIRKSPNEVLLELYGAYKKEFFSWSYKTFGASEDDAGDCFQDAMIIFYRNITSGKLIELNSSVKTYLFSIGKNLLLRKFKIAQRELPMNDEFQKYVVDEELEFRELYDGNEIENKIAGIVKSMRDPCKSILRYFYFRGFSMEEIAIEMKYKNAQTVKAQKVRCIKEIQSLVNRKMRTEL